MYPTEKEIQLIMDMQLYKRLIDKLNQELDSAKSQIKQLEQELTEMADLVDTGPIYIQGHADEYRISLRIPTHDLKHSYSPTCRNLVLKRINAHIMQELLKLLKKG